MKRRFGFNLRDKTATIRQIMTSELKQPAPFDTVIVCSGHMIDSPDRKEPRFPEAKAESVRAAIARQLERWQVGKNALAICGGACGADTLFGEECLRRGAKLKLLLAQAVEDFVRESVAPAGRNWVERFDALRKQSEVAILPEAAHEKEKDLSIYERTNLWIIRTAQQVVRDNDASLRALLVWDEKATGDGPGGTSDFEKRVRNLGGEIAIINPTTI